MNLMNSCELQNQRNQMQRFFTESYRTDEVEIFHSPSGRYTLTVVHYEYHEGIRRHDYTQGIVTCCENTAYRVEVNRNFGLFLHAWIPFGDDELLLTGQDYQGYTMVDLGRAKVVDYVPEDALQGRGFCWAAIHPQPGKQMLAVEGCYNGAEYELVFYDFSAPLHLPYRELGRITAYEEALGWTADGFFAYLDEEGNRREVNPRE